MNSMPEMLYRKIVKDSYSWTPQTAFIRTEMEVGPARQRQRASTMPTTFSCKMMLTRHQVAVLEAWYRHKIDNGAAWFAMPVLTETGMTETNVRFSEPYQVAMQGHDLYEITCNLEIDEMPMMSEEELDLVLGIVEPKYDGQIRYDGSYSYGVL